MCVIVQILETGFVDVLVCVCFVAVWVLVRDVLMFVAVVRVNVDLVPVGMFMVVG
jgi:hypothetical protein